MHINDCFYENCGYIWNCITKKRSIETTSCACHHKNFSIIYQNEGNYEDFYEINHKNCTSISDQNYSSISCFLSANNIDLNKTIEYVNLHCSQYQNNIQDVMCTISKPSQRQGYSGSIISDQTWKHNVLLNSILNWEDKCRIVNFPNESQLKESKIVNPHGSGKVTSDQFRTSQNELSSNIEPKLNKMTSQPTIVTRLFHLTNPSSSFHNTKLSSDKHENFRFNHELINPPLNTKSYSNENTNTDEAELPTTTFFSVLVNNHGISHNISKQISDVFGAKTTVASNLESSNKNFDLSAHTDTKLKHHIDDIENNSNLAEIEISKKNENSYIHNIELSDSVSMFIIFIFIFCLIVSCFFVCLLRFKIKFKVSREKKHFLLMKLKRLFVRNQKKN